MDYHSIRGVLAIYREQRLDLDIRVDSFTIEIASPEDSKTRRVIGNAFDMTVRSWLRDLPAGTWIRVSKVYTSIPNLGIGPIRVRRILQYPVRALSGGR